LCLFFAALASLFLAGYLPKVRGGINLSGYLACLIVYVIVHFLSHLVLTTLAFLSDRKEKKAEIHPMTGTTNENQRWRIGQGIRGRRTIDTGENSI
jgi:hypothetical protein